MNKLLRDILPQCLGEIPKFLSLRSTVIVSLVILYTSLRPNREENIIQTIFVVTLDNVEWAEIET